jgi:hypothetical protein
VGSGNPHPEPEEQLTQTKLARDELPDGLAMFLKKNGA